MSVLEHSKKKQFHALLDRQETTVRRVCRMYFGDSESAKDLYQDIIIKLWEHFGELKDQQVEQDWVYTIARHTATDHYRKQRRTMISSPPPPSVAEIAICEDPHEEKLEELYKVIRILEPEEKELIYLYLDHHTLAQIANRMGTTEDAIRGRLYRLRQKMKTLTTQL